ncbi:hypothetical protein ACQP1P_35135 [Dactylosporangium sp. CA-052675]|uniref:hypothetical protein n=1 Tax=Dactylosporangium sp. CA-052675 TaxID=3239927 RepID=UPI003D927024
MPVRGTRHTAGPSPARTGSWSPTGTGFCLTPKHTDPQGSPNTAKQGDCLTGGEGRDARPRPCTDRDTDGDTDRDTDRDTARTVLERFEDVADRAEACDKTPGSTRALVLHWDEAGPKAQADAADDVVLRVAADDPEARRSRSGMSRRPVYGDGPRVDKPRADP